MVVDSSVLVAIVLEEAREIEYIAKLTEASSLKMSAGTLTEASMVLLSRGGQVKVEILDALLARLDVEIVSVDHAHALLARQAFDRFGKGRDKVGLNMGDCFSYALASPVPDRSSSKGMTSVRPISLLLDGYSSMPSCVSRNA
jgi:ribonuclease VapC